jgi:hypothetical protein
MTALPDVLDALAARLARSLTLDAADGELLGYSLQGDDADAARVASILHRRVPADVLAWQARHLDPRARDPVVVPANPQLGMSARLGLVIHDPNDGRVLGTLWMPGSGPALTEAELVAVRAACDGLAELLTGITEPAPGRIGRDTDRLVRRLCAERSGDAVDRLRRAVPALVDGTVEFVAAVPTGLDGDGDGEGTGVAPLDGAEFSALANAVSPTLRGQRVYVGASVAVDHTLVLTHGGSAVDRLLDALDVLVRRATGRGVAIGVGEPVPFTAQAARRAIRQALAAAELAALDPALPRHCRWADLGAYRGILDGRPDEGLLTGLREAGATTAMLEHTLETYLDLGGDVQATAARLNLHRSSLYYRLERIAGLLGADLADGRTRLALHLALKSRRAARRLLR